MTETDKDDLVARLRYAHKWAVAENDYFNPELGAEAADEIERLRLQLAKAQWQPIETAPKDGSHILACRIPIGIRVTINTHPPTVVHWFDDPDEPGFYTSVNERAPEYPYNPTHWMPLLSLPDVERPAGCNHWPALPSSKGDEVTTHKTAQEKQ